MPDVTGIHHVTCMASRPKPNLEFYTKVLGMRLVKRSVNQDDPGTYHLFYADGAGTPGSDLTFFPWPNLAAGQRGVGETADTVLAVPPGSLDYWTDRLETHGVGHQGLSERFGQPALSFSDPDGLALTLTETSDDAGDGSVDPAATGGDGANVLEFVPWKGGTVPVEVQVRRIHAVRVAVAAHEPTAEVLINVLDRHLLGESDGWSRYGSPDGRSGTFIDVRTSDGPAARLGRGSVHHVAWRVADQSTQERVRTRVREAGLRPTPVIDRFWFKSVYFHEPGGVLFEIATDGPGFTVDEDADRLGEDLILPPWLEARRDEIEGMLPPLD